MQSGSSNRKSGWCGLMGGRCRDSMESGNSFLFRYVGSFGGCQTSDQTCASCQGKWLLKSIAVCVEVLSVSHSYLHVTSLFVTLRWFVDTYCWGAGGSSPMTGLIIHRQSTSTVGCHIGEHASIMQPDAW